jgi:hypothetical protein
MRSLILAAALSVALSGCATDGSLPTPGSVTTNVQNAVTDTQSVVNGGVAIVTDLVKAAVAIAGPITQIVAVVSAL